MLVEGNERQLWVENGPPSGAYAPFRLRNQLNYFEEISSSEVEIPYYLVLILFIGVSL